MKFKKIASIAHESIDSNSQYIESRFTIISMVAVIAFPFYYIVWHYIFPQPYENLTLRLLGSALFFPFMFVRHWPQWLNRYKSIHWYIATLYGLPFFFTFMLLMNEVSTVWLMSTLVAVFLMILLLSWYNLLIQFVAGTTLGWFAFSLTTGHAQLQSEYWKYSPIFLFAIVAGGLLNFSSKRMQKERLRAMLTTASNIAHELRTPLLGIKSGATGLRQYLPALLEGYSLAASHGLIKESIRLAHLNSMRGVLDRIEGEANHSNTIIDMLLMNADADGVLRREPVVCSMAHCIETALDRYPFMSEKERALLIWNRDADFCFHGTELLMVHVLFNLMKNALYHINKAGKGNIVIRLNLSPQGNKLIFRDTGSGIAPEVLPHIFTRFYSRSSENEKNIGAGVGLAFCKSVMSSLGGTIDCESQLGEYTEFTLIFPPLNIVKENA